MVLSQSEFCQFLPRGKQLYAYFSYIFGYLKLLWKVFLFQIITDYHLNPLYKQLGPGFDSFMQQTDIILD